LTRGRALAGGLIAALALGGGCSTATTAPPGTSTSAPTSTSVPVGSGAPGGVATTVPGPVADPLSAPVRPRDALVPTGVSAPVVRAPGADFLTPAQTAGLPLSLVGSWERLARSADARFLAIGVSVAGCTRLVALEVTVTVVAVTITPRLRTAAPGTLCPAIVVVARYVVDLGAPLGARPLLHPPMS
jgi:hypothetical protein